MISPTAIVYIQDNVSWALGFGICVMASFTGLAFFSSGKRFYRHKTPQGSPFVGLARVVVTSTKKRNVKLSSRSEDYYYGHDHGKDNVVDTAPSRKFRYKILEKQNFTLL